MVFTTAQSVRWSGSTHSWTTPYSKKVEEGTGRHTSRKIFYFTCEKLIIQYTSHIFNYLWWLSSTLSGDVANRKSHSWITGLWSSSDARQSCVATSGCHATTFQRICTKATCQCTSFCNPSYFIIFTIISSLVVKDQV